MAQFVQANIPGQFQAGQQAELSRQSQVQQFGQNQFNAEQNKINAPIKTDQARANLLATQQSNAANSELSVFTRNVNTALELQSTPDEEKATFLMARIEEGELLGRDMSQSKKALEMVNSGQLEELKKGSQDLIDVGEKRGIIKAAPIKKLSSLQQKVEAEGLDPLTPEGQARAREITQGSRTDPSLKPSDQQLINKASEGQLQSSTFANRVGAANEILAGLEATEGFDATSITAAFLESIPGGNIALSSDQQKFSQAKRDFITAVLRKESGAAIGVDEFINEDKKFFPQVGDKPAVLKQKALGRKRAFESLKKQSKGVFDVQFGKKSGALSDAEKAELEQLRAELG